MTDEIAQSQYAILGSDGGIETYLDPYANVTDADVVEATQLESFICEKKQVIDQSYLMIGAALSRFADRGLYLARGYPSLKSWAESPEVNISYRTVHDLIRIYREIVPILADHGVQPTNIGVAVMRSLLPVLADDDGPAKVVELLPELEGLPARAAQDHIKSARGLDRPIDAPSPAIFRARVTLGETFHVVQISCSDGVDYYDVGTLRIRPKHYARWQSRFGAFLEES